MEPDHRGKEGTCPLRVKVRDLQPLRRLSHALRPEDHGAEDRVLDPEGVVLRHHVTSGSGAQQLPGLSAARGSSSHRRPLSQVEA